MKLRHYQKHTFRICMAYVRNQSVKNTDRLMATLNRWARSNEPAYDYVGRSAIDAIEYCADRMNSGRAKAILNLIGDEATKKLEALFNE